MPEYAKVTVMGSPITKSNFKLHNRNGRAILPVNTGTSLDRFHEYEETIAASARAQNPGVCFEESLIGVLRVYYKSEKRHPDTNNITKSIFDGIEKSGLIVNDAQIRRLIIEEYYDRVEPRFELELFAESVFRMSYDIRRHEDTQERRLYEPPSNKKSVKFPSASGFSEANLKAIQANLEKREKARETPCPEPEVHSARSPVMNKRPSGAKIPADNDGAEAPLFCSICRKPVRKGSYMKADGGRTILCKSCFRKLF